MTATEHAEHSLRRLGPISVESFDAVDDRAKGLDNVAAVNDASKRRKQMRMRSCRIQMRNHRNQRSQRRRKSQMKTISHAHKLKSMQKRKMRVFSFVRKMKIETGGTLTYGVGGNDELPLGKCERCQSDVYPSTLRVFSKSVRKVECKVCGNKEQAMRREALWPPQCFEVMDDAARTKFWKEIADVDRKGLKMFIEECVETARHEQKLFLATSQYTHAA